MKNIKKFFSNLLISEVESLEGLSLPELKTQKSKFTIYKWLHRFISLIFCAMTSYMLVYQPTTGSLILGFGITLFNALLAGYWRLLEFSAQREIETITSSNEKNIIH